MMNSNVTEPWTLELDVSEKFELLLHFSINMARSNCTSLSLMHSVRLLNASYLQCLDCSLMLWPPRPLFQYVCPATRQRVCLLFGKTTFDIAYICKRTYCVPCHCSLDMTVNIASALEPTYPALPQRPSDMKLYMASICHGIHRLMPHDIWRLH